MSEQGEIPPTRDVDRFMAEKLSRDGILERDAVVHEVLHRFGDRFVQDTASRGIELHPAVLDQFGTLALDAQWSDRDRCWYPGDPGSDVRGLGTG